MDPTELKSQLIRTANDVTDDALVQIGAKPSLFDKIMGAITDNGITIGFTLAIVLLFATALTLHYRFPGRSTGSFVSSAPGLLTTMGILGTFFGIFVGLLDFNVDAVDKSVPTLLDGLKVAFITSILGITAALILRSILSLSQPAGPSEEIGPEDIYRVLRDIRENNIDSNRELRSAVSGMGKQSLASQLQSLREALEGQGKDAALVSEDGFRALIREIRSLNERTGNVVDLMERLDEQAAQMERRLGSLESNVGDAETTAKRAGDS